MSVARHRLILKTRTAVFFNDMGFHPFMLRVVEHEQKCPPALAEHGNILLLKVELHQKKTALFYFPFLKRDFQKGPSKFFPLVSREDGPSLQAHGMPSAEELWRRSASTDGKGLFFSVLPCLRGRFSACAA